MKITIQDLLDREIFKDYSILSGKDHLKKPLESVSILETPDFERYIIEKSLILTTFYPVKNDIEKAKELIYALEEHGTAGIIIKVPRYINEVPEEIVSIAETLNVPIITLNYDANLSVLFNNILSEIQSKDYSNASFDETYANLLKSVYENPTTKTLMNVMKEIPDLDFLIDNLQTHTKYYTSDTINHYHETFRRTKNLIKRIDDKIYYSEDVIYDDKPIYRMVFLAKESRRHVIHNTIEITKLIIILIYQKKMENRLKLNQFLQNFVSNFASSYSNDQFIEASKHYNWDIRFPVTMILFKFEKNGIDTVNPNLIDYTKTVLINKFHLNNRELKYTYLNGQLLFIINTLDDAHTHKTLETVHALLSRQFNPMSLSLVHSNPLHHAEAIPSTYSLLSDAFNHLSKRDLPIQVFNQTNIELLNLLKNINSDDMRSFSQKHLQSVLEYEEKHHVPLLYTMKTFIDTKFNAKKTSELLFIHYNTLRYRLNILKKLGHDLMDTDTNHFDLYFALYLHSIFAD